MAETRVWGVLDWRLHAVATVVCALGAVADVTVGYPWIALICAFASGSCSMSAVDFWYRQKMFRQRREHEAAWLIARGWRDRAANYRSTKDT